MITGYIIFEGKKYLCGMGNTKRAARAAAEYNAQEIEKRIGYCPVHYTSNEVHYPDFTELLTK